MRSRRRRSPRCCRRYPRAALAPSALGEAAAGTGQLRADPPVWLAALDQHVAKSELARRPPRVEGDPPIFLRAPPPPPGGGAAAAES